MSVTLSRKIVNIISILGIVATIIATIYFIRLGVFKDINALRGLVGQSVILGPIIFMLIQIIQVVIPIIPGGVSCAAGVLIFGPTMGFVYNYVGPHGASETVAQGAPGEAEEGADEGADEGVGGALGQV